METLKTKLVNVNCRRPIRLRNRLVRGIYREVLTIEEIADCISQQATVYEILPTGDTVVLDFTNYNVPVLPSISEEEAAKAQAEEEARKAAEAQAAAEEAKKKEKEATASKTKEENPTVAPVKDEEIVEDAEEKVSEAKKAAKEKK
nr:MAG TPA: hypothetical protein [Caudoviricetes sp.]